MKTKSSSRGGQALIEFAVMMSVLLLIFLGIMEWSRMFYTREVLVHAVREAGRFGQVGLTAYDGTDYGSPQSAIVQVLYDSSCGLLPSTKAAVIFSNDTTTNADIGLANSTFTIRVEYQYDFISIFGPFVKKLSGEDMTNSFKIVASSSFKAEKYNDDF